MNIKDLGKELLGKLWDLIMRQFSGKRIVVLGVKATGKTTFQRFLREGILVKEYEETFRDTLGGSTFREFEYTLHIKRGEDIGGDEKFQNYWEQLLEQCDYCFYIFNAHQVYEGDEYQITKMEEHLINIRKIIAANGSHTRLYVIGNFTDRIPSFNDDRRNAERRIRPRIINALDDAGIELAHVIYGNMADDKSAGRLLHEIIDHVRRDEKKR